MRVSLKENKKKPSLSHGKTYFVVGIAADCLRIINDEGDPCLYSRRLFDIVDKNKPEDWVVKVGEEGEKYAYPKEMNEAGFFEDYFDGDAKTREIFWNYVKEKVWV